MAFVYILYSEKLNQYYKGSANDVQVRLMEHNSGKQKSTKSGIPWVLALQIEKTNISEARILEKKMKNINSRDRLESFIKKYGGEIFGKV